MKKLYLLLLLALLSFIPATHAVEFYQLDQPVLELNGYTLREIFQNRNRAVPDLSTAINLGGEVYRLYNDNGITVDYNVNNGIRTVNGTWTAAPGNTIVPLLNVNGLTLTVSVEVISGDLPAGTYYRPSGSVFEYQLGDFEGIAYEVPYTRDSDYIRMVNGAVFNNFQYKLQLEKGSISTPYQVPTNGPYSDVDLGQFDFTPEQIQTYYSLYLTAVRFENIHDPLSVMPLEFFMISTFFMYLLIMGLGYFTKSKYLYFAGAILWFVPIFNYQNIFIITTSVIVFISHLLIIFYSDKDDVFE